ncbi:MAG: DUF1476 domain-containing protein [Holosporales bacterium]|jgi:hypothetical protein|nr:DUF1476 domain-containing protein [Holosporales bacterium]
MMASFSDYEKDSSAVASSFSDYFKSRTKTHRLFGLWVSELLGLHLENAEEYVENLLLIDLFGGDEIALLEKVHSDLLEKNIFISESHLQNQMEYFWEMAAETEKKPF